MLIKIIFQNTVFDSFYLNGAVFTQLSFSTQGSQGFKGFGFGSPLRLDVQYLHVVLLGGSIS